MIMTVKIGEKIKDLRKKADVTQEKFAEYLGVSAQAVSKWEVEGCYPDLELLAPIANFFDITIDELMGFDKAKEQEEIDGYMQRYIEAANADHITEAIAIIREANAKYPGNFELMQRLANILFIYETIAPDEEHKKNALKEVISLGEKIRSECKDDKIRRQVLKIICIAYREIGESEKALKLANDNYFITAIYDSDIMAYTSLLDGDKLIGQQQKNMIEMMIYSCATMNTLSKDFAPEYRLAIYKSILDMYFTIFKDGDFNIYGVDIPGYYMGIAEVYIELKDTAKALENLKNAADNTIAFGHFNQPKQSINVAFTSPLVNKLSLVHILTLREVGHKGNEAYRFLKSLGNEKFNPIRDTLAFKEICEKLEKYAVENVYL
jgi:transcriptional regulator with XRE-family HTH domain